VYSHWPDPDVGRQALQAKTHLDTYSRKTKGKGENGGEKTGRGKFISNSCLEGV